MSYLIWVFLFTWGSRVTPDSLTMWFRVGALGHLALVPPLGGGRDVAQPHGWSTMSTWWSPHNKSGHQGSDELPWLAILCAHCHTSVLGRLCCPWAHGERTTEAPYVALSWTGPMYLFSRLSLIRTLQLWVSSVNPSSRLSNLRVVLWAVPHHIFSSKHISWHTVSA